MNKGAHELRREYWHQIIRECNAREQGITKLAWFQEHNINSKSYYYWQKQFRSEAVATVRNEKACVETSTASVSAPAFFDITPSVCSSIGEKVPVSTDPVQQTAMGAGAPELMIQINECRIFVNSTIQEKTLETVIKVLRHA